MDDTLEIDMWEASVYATMHQDHTSTWQCVTFDAPYLRCWGDDVYPGGKLHHRCTSNQDHEIGLCDRHYRQIVEPSGTLTSS